MTQPPFVVLSDGIITLRCLQLGDVPAHLAGEDEEQVHWLNEGRRSTPDRVASWVLDNQQEWATSGPRRHFGIRDTATVELIGTTEAHLIKPGVPGGVNISYVVFPTWRGRGVAARAVRLLCAWLGTDADCRLAVIDVAPGNAHSRAVPLAAGFVEVGPVTPPGGEVLIRYERPLRPASATALRTAGPPPPATARRSG